MSLFNRYCIRCHGIDGRGVWDIPRVPNFTDAHWQASRSDSDLVHIILEGKGAVMPPFRRALTAEEAWAMARYLRTFLPGTETPRPDFGTSKEKGMSTLPDKIDATPAAPPPGGPIQERP
jgi:mono/diheme cytochrome c family protein